MNKVVNVLEFCAWLAMTGVVAYVMFKGLHADYCRQHDTERGDFAACMARY